MDKTLKCKDCGTEFVFTERDQEFYASKGFSDPIRCKDCRMKKKQRYENMQGDNNEKKDFTRNY